MKIAFVVEVFPRISETFILDQITGFLDLGHQVVILSLWNPDLAVPFHKDIERYKLIEKTEFLTYARRSARGRLKRLMYFSQHFPSALQDWSSETSARPPFRYLFGPHIQKVYPLLQHHVDLVYCHFGTTAREFSFLRRHLKKPFVAAFWGYDVDLLPQEIPAAYDDVFNLFDLFCTSSDYLAGKLSDLGCPKQRLITQRIGLKLDAMRAYPIRRTETPLKLLSVGRLVPEKGFAFSLRALSHLDGEFEYSIIGHGPEKGSLEQLIRELGLETRVKLLGSKPRDEVFQKMAESDMYLCPSLRESFGVANLEASFFQLPIVASRVGGIPEIVQHGLNGLLVPPGDVKGLAWAIRKLAESRDIRRQLGEAGRPIVESQFDHQSLMLNLEKQFTQLATALR